MAYNLLRSFSLSSQKRFDGFEVDYHSHPCPSHEFMGGKMYAYDGNVSIGGKTYENGSEALTRLGDYGCLHFKTDVILGVSEPRYDDEWLEEKKKKDTELIEYNGVKKTKYEWQQGARRLERGTRQQRDIAYMAKASGDKTLERRANEKIAVYRKGYDDLCDTVGLEKRYNRMATFPAKTIDKVEKSGIIKEQSKKNITAITENAIEKVPKVSISGFTDEQNTFIQQQHKELLKYAKENNDSKEVAFVFRDSLTDRTEYIGTEDSLDFGTALNGKGNNLFVMHNHPRNSSYSDRDIQFFTANDTVKTFSIVKNNGGIEIITKTDDWNAERMRTIYARAFKKHVKTGTDIEIDKAVEYMLKRNGGILKWIK